ncbi:hypothetical protein [Cytobacillus horneckiae]|uniref:Uncharacterized protein n=1 Tax=Cytobacillus horneckiae TaxID=549687 RepID=A0A2N0ZGZ1_9BACI|nr:hypothetical protein [Cytobacillus horneckiae]MED2940690.1 hypothetical protein [Cytobacillus horneckiae]PKG28779.1 hypothetical protein CWS20_11880 [Cytobacillus horneckiae]
MAEIKQFNSFPVSYCRLSDDFLNQRVLAEYYHHDMPSEPSISVLGVLTDVFISNDDDGYINLRFENGTDISFKKENYLTNISNEEVVFTSKYDSETYCIITIQ